MWYTPASGYKVPKHNLWGRLGTCANTVTDPPVMALPFTQILLIIRLLLGGAGGVTEVLGSTTTPKKQVKDICVGESVVFKFKISLIIFAEKILDNSANSFTNGERKSKTVEKYTTFESSQFQIK